MSIKGNLDKIFEDIREITDRNIDIVAVTKFVEIDHMIEAFELGLSCFGENRPQEIKRKYELIKKDVIWHQIGTLQKNKVKYIIDKVDLIHSLDSISLANEINKQAEKIQKKQNCLLQIKVSEEESKHGIAEEQAMEIFNKIKNECINVNICGIMGMAPYFDNPEESRMYFKRLYAIFKKIKEESGKSDFKILSMGMSNDYKIAIEEGATMIRIGSALFS